MDDGSLEVCGSCTGSLVLGSDACRACGAGPEAVCVLSYAGCGQCRPERLLQGSVRRGPAAGLLARAGLSYAAREAQQGAAKKGGVVAPRVSQQTGVIINDADPLMNQPVFHIVEEPGGIRRLSECEVPNEIYNEARLKDLSIRHPKLSPGVLEHLGSLEPFLDVYNSRV